MGRIKSIRVKRTERKPYCCSKCGETKPDRFYKGSGSKSKCKACAIKETMARRKLDPEYSEKQAAYYERWYKEQGRERKPDYGDVIILWQARHPNAGKVARKVARAIQNGLLERSLICSMCGRNKTRINAHQNDYNFPFDIMWLCSSCHKKIHLRSST